MPSVLVLILPVSFREYGTEDGTQSQAISTLGLCGWSTRWRGSRAVLFPRIEFWFLFWIETRISDEATDSSIIFFVYQFKMLPWQKSHCSQGIFDIWSVSFEALKNNRSSCAQACLKWCQIIKVPLIEGI